MSFLGSRVLRRRLSRLQKRCTPIVRLLAASAHRASKDRVRYLPRWANADRSGEPPIYLALVREAHLRREVILQERISKEGNLEALRLIRGDRCWLQPLRTQ